MIRAMRKPIVLGAAAAFAALALVAGGAYIYYFSGLRTAPAELGLTAIPSPAGSTPSAPAAAGLTGKWTVVSGSIAGYRVKELFVGQTSKHEAVARTSTVSGGMNVSGDSSGYQVSDVTITVEIGTSQLIQLTRCATIGMVASAVVSSRRVIVPIAVGITHGCVDRG